MFQPNASAFSGGLVVYGFGSVGQRIVDELIDAGLRVELILDRAKHDQVYRDVPIRSLDDLGEVSLAGKPVLIGLHNHYVDIHRLHRDLIAAGASRILTPVNLAELLPAPQTRPSYWLDPDYDYSEHEGQFEALRQLLADETSLALLNAILRYRRDGDIADCPIPSLEDEYVPSPT